MTTMATRQTRSIDLGLWHKQDWFVRSARRFAAFIAGRGAGKTVAGACKAIPQIIATPNGLGMVTAPSHDSIRDSLLPVCRRYWEPIGGRFNDSAPYRCGFPNGHMVSFRSAEKPELARGPSLSWAWLDEAGLNRKGMWAIMLPALRFDGKASPAWITTTPKQARKGRDDLQEILRKNRFDQVTASTWENPNLSRQYVRDLMREYSGKWLEQELEGRFVTLGAGTINRDWFLGKVVDTPPAGLRWVRAWDPAFSVRQTADRTAGIAMARDESGRIYLKDGISGRWELHERKRVILDTMASEDYEVGIAATASQSDVWRDIATDTRAARRTVTPIRETGDKMSRAMPWISRAAQGLVYLVAGAWIPHWLSIWEEFPDGEHDDEIDAVTLAYLLLDEAPSLDWLPSAAEAIGM